MGGVTVMAISTVFVKICGALYKIPLNNILGDEGVTHFMSAYLDHVRSSGWPQLRQ